MSHLLFGYDQDVLNWALAREPEGLAFQNAWVAGILDNHGNLSGAIAICQVSPGGVSIGVESDGAISRRVVRDTFAFIFHHLGASRCEMVTRKTNKVMKKHAPTTLGFKFEGVRRDWYGPGQDGLAFSMTPETCKWIDHGLSIAA